MARDKNTPATSAQPKLSLSVVRLTPGRDIIGAHDLTDLAGAVPSLAYLIRAVGVAEPPMGRLSKAVADRESVVAAAETLERILSEPVVQACLIYTAMTPEGLPAPPDLRITGVSDQTTTRLKNILLHLADAVAALTRRPCVRVERDPQDSNHRKMRVQWTLQRGEPLASPKVVEQLESAAKDLKDLLGTIDPPLGDSAKDTTDRQLPSSSADTNATQTDERPRWERQRRKLWLGTKLVRVYRRVAARQFLILDAFEAKGWPPEIVAPQECLSPKDTVEGLNDQRTLRLRFTWGVIESEDKKDTLCIRWQITD